MCMCRAAHVFLYPWSAIEHVFPLHFYIDNFNLFALVGKTCMKREGVLTLISSWVCLVVTECWNLLLNVVFRRVGQEPSHVVFAVMVQREKFHSLVLLVYVSRSLLNLRFTCLLGVMEYFKHVATCLYKLFCSHRWAIDWRLYTDWVTYIKSFNWRESRCFQELISEYLWVWRLTFVVSSFEHWNFQQLFLLLLLSRYVWWW